MGAAAKRFASRNDPSLCNEVVHSRNVGAVVQGEVVSLQLLNYYPLYFFTKKPPQVVLH